MVAAMGPKYQKYIWWKKYMTWIQLVSISEINLKVAAQRYEQSVSERNPATLDFKGRLNNGDKREDTAWNKYYA
jgi:hypothetical protein